jgi:hypothetical protein
MSQGLKTAAVAPGRAGPRWRTGEMMPGRSRFRARVRLEVGDDPGGWTPPVSERKEKKGEKGKPRARGGLRKGWATRGKRGRKEGKKAAWAGPCGRG